MEPDSPVAFRPRHAQRIVFPQFRSNTARLGMPYIQVLENISMLGVE